MSLFDRSGALPDLLPYRSFLAPGVVDMRGMGVMAGYNMTGPSPETCSPDEISNARDQLAGALRHLGSGDMVQFIQHRDPAPAPKINRSPYLAANLVHQELTEQFEAGYYWLAPCQLYLTHQFETAAQNWLQALLVAHKTTKVQSREAQLTEHALQRFDACRSSTGIKVELEQMDSAEMFRALLRAVTYHDFPAPLPAPEVPLYEVVGAERLIGGYEPFINGYYLRPIVVTIYPTETTPQMLAALQMDQGPLTISARFIALDAHDAQRELDDLKRKWNRTDFKGWWGVTKDWISREKPEPNQDIKEQLADLNEAATDLSRGETFGWITTTIIVRDQEQGRAEQRVRDLMNVLHRMGIMAMPEDLGALDAIYSSWPGNGWSNKRRPMSTAKNFADLILPATRYEGG